MVERNGEIKGRKRDIFCTESVKISHLIFSQTIFETYFIPFFKRSLSCITVVCVRT